MKFATYNVWNENKGRGNRFEQLINEIHCVDADIIGLQEITEHFFNNFLTKKTGYKYCEFRKYINEDEGLTILSKYPIKDCFFLNTSEEFAYSAALNVLIEIGNSILSFTNVHLPWHSIKVREEQIIAIDKYIHQQKDQANAHILVGDFNCGFNSSVHRYLSGEQTINGNESLCWEELSIVAKELKGIEIKPTLDFVNNPRWGGKNNMEIPYVADRIYVLADLILKSYKIFGTDISLKNGLSASDHYGVFVEADIIL